LVLACRCGTSLTSCKFIRHVTVLTWATKLAGSPIYPVLSIFLNHLRWSSPWISLLKCGSGPSCCIQIRLLARQYPYTNKAVIHSLEIYVNRKPLNAPR
jgi:hypothetical protein